MAADGAAAAAARARLREEGLRDARNRELMSRGYPPGPPQEAAKKLNLRDINTYMKLHEEFGDIFMLPLGDVPLVVTRDPNQIRELLGGSATERFPRPPNVIANIKILFGRAQIALDGEEHQANKRMLSQWLFAEPHNAKMAEPFSEIVSDALERFHAAAAQPGGKLEVYSLCELAAADVSAAISLGRLYGAVRTGECPQLESLKICDRIFLRRAMNKRWRETEPAAVTEEFERNKKVIADTFLDGIAKIKGGTPLNHNILTHMVEQNLANRSASCPAGCVPTELETVSNMIGFLAGVGNTARMLTIALEMGARRPDVQERILAELHEHLGGLGREAAAEAAARGLAVPAAGMRELYTYQRLSKLEYLKCVMLECLRLYTPSTSVAPRHCTEPSPLGDFTIPAGTNVMANIYGAHRHGQYWSHPEEFDPDRFNEAAPGEPPQARGFAKEGLFPFSIGGHSCIGRNLAQEFGLMFWAAVFGSFQVTKGPGQPEAQFNTLKSDQILGFIEAVNGCHVTLAARPRDEAREAAATARLAAESPAERAAVDEAVEALRRDAAGDAAGAVAGGGAAAPAAGLADPARPIPMSEVARHDSEESGVWLVIDGKVYDVTPWLQDHPGGGQILVRCGGRDVTKLFFETTKHSSFAISEAAKYQIGVVAPEPRL